MVKKTKESAQIEHYQVPMQGIYSNDLGIAATDNEIFINFGLSTRSYFEPHDDEDFPVARIVLSWETAESLLLTLRKVISDHKKEQKSKQKTKTESGEASK